MSFMVRTTIAAAPQTVWHILTDAPGYCAWNTTVTGIDGRIALGETVTVHAQSSPGRAFPVKVTTFAEPARMVWTSAMPLGLFKGERTFELTMIGSATEFSMREIYTGLMAPLITKSIPDLQSAFDEFAACLKTRAEHA